MKDWICIKCGHEVIAEEKPVSSRWSDGHVCIFKETHFEEEATQ